MTLARPLADTGALKGAMSMPLIIAPMASQVRRRHASPHTCHTRIRLIWNKPARSRGSPLLGWVWPFVFRCPARQGFIIEGNYVRVGGVSQLEPFPLAHKSVFAGIGPVQVPRALIKLPCDRE
jgi:hypothetical protein